MNIIVCVKQVPEIGEMKFDEVNKVLIRDGIANILNPFDRRAIAEAARLKAEHGGEITALTMGPPLALRGLLECFAVGADKAVHLLDAAFSGADTLATSRALAAAIARQPFDLIMCGKSSVDAETGQVGPQVAELLDIPHITAVSKLTFDVNAGEVIAERETDEGFETVRATLPLLITAAERLIRPLKIKQPDIDKVADRPVQVVTARELSSDIGIFGQAGSPTRVSEIFTLQKNRQVEFFDGSTLQMIEACGSKLCARGLFGEWEDSQAIPQAVDTEVGEITSGNTILIVGESFGGNLRSVTLELLNKGRELARKLGGKVAALLIGPDAAGYADELAAHGADHVYVLEGERFAQYNPFDYTNALIEVIRKEEPFAVLIPSTANGRDYAPRVAARLGLGLTADCVGLELNDREELIQLKPAFGGQIVASILSRTWPQMATVRPGMLAKGVANDSRKCTVEQLSIPEADNRYRVLSRTDGAGTAGIELDDAEIVVCVGSGIGGPENLPVIEEFAKATGAAIGATRRVVDAGWLPMQQQIGITGRAISPKLYIGVGVRGAFHHTIGIQRSGIVLAINSDPEAAIFEVADYGIVGDWSEILPALTKELARKKAEAAGK
jgi:electron transfer flavoprotein alpha subunit